MVQILTDLYPWFAVEMLSGTNECTFSNFSGEAPPDPSLIYRLRRTHRRASPPACNKFVPSPKILELRQSLALIISIQRSIDKIVVGLL